ncbi:MAG TPA: SDR family NAD(P)-dependent oxidoreductase, partial [Spirochaetota bacterium]
MNKKVVLVTGSSRGIGANLIENFAKNNYKVVINYSKSGEEASALYSRVIALFGEDSALCIKADVSDRSDVNAMFDTIYGSFGKIDVLINNAGINIDKPFMDMGENEWTRVISTILTGSFNCSQEFAKRFKENAGHIINIGSLTAISGRKNGINYCTARAGILNFTHCLALELAPHICVNTITPGCIDTEEVRTR